MTNLINYEIDCQLFSKCNLNCKFCFEHKKTNIDTNYILSIPNNIINNIIDIHKQTNFNNLLIFSWGGQVFADNIQNQIFSIYKQYMQNFKNIINQYIPNINIKFIWTSNGAFQKTQRVKNFIQQTNSIINFSYDPLYRYSTNKQKQLAISNFKYFKKYLQCIGFILIKPLINIQLLQSDPVLSPLSQFNTYQLDLNYYIGNTNYSLFLPNDNDIFTFYKWAIDNKKYNINAINNILSNYFSNQNTPNRFCKCQNYVHCAKNIFTHNCAHNSNYPNEFFYGKNTNILTENTCYELKKSLAIQQRGCLFCQWYNKCPMFCNISQLFKYYKKDICPLKRIFQYIKQNENVIKNTFDLF